VLTFEHILGSSFKVGESGLGEEFKALPEDIEDALCEGPELPQ
jgi:hypothetical protein